MTTSYLALAGLGKNHWWRYLLGVGVIIFFMFIGQIPILGLIMAVGTDDDPTTNVNPETVAFEGVNPLWPYLGINFSLIMVLVGVLVAVSLLHKRSIRTVITPKDKINWKLMITGGVVYFLLTALATVIDASFRPEEYRISVDLKQFFIFLPFVLIITPFQAAAEELLFRGYIMQGLGVLTRITAIPVIGSSLIFMLGHFWNPEMQTTESLLLPLVYFLMALFLAIITVKSNSLELAIGAHTANNLFTVLIMNYSNSALSSPSLFTTSEVDPVASIISFVLIAVAFYWIMFMRKPREV